MKFDQAQQVIDEASQDKRLNVELDARRTRKNTTGGYRVKVTLRKFQTSITATKPEDWQEIRQLWQDL